MLTLGTYLPQINNEQSIIDELKTQNEDLNRRIDRSLELIKQEFSRFIYTVWVANTGCSGYLENSGTFDEKADTSNKQETMYTETKQEKFIDVQRLPIIKRVGQKQVGHTTNRDALASTTSRTCKFSV